MVICGIKLTHDGAVALIEDGRLVFCVEFEKLENSERFRQIENTDDILHIFELMNYDISKVDKFVIDGWGGDDDEQLAVQPRLTQADAYNIISAKTNELNNYGIKVALYEESKKDMNVLKQWEFEDGLKIGDKEYGYLSYLHVAGHIMSVYATSNFSKVGEDSYVLVWDGGMYPRLYYYNNAKNKIECLGPIFLFIGNIYSIFSQHFGPFKVGERFAKDSLSVAGKVMAYIAKGKNHEELFPIFDKIYKKSYDYPMGFANTFANEFKKEISELKISDEDILCTFHFYLQNMLISKLKKKIERHGKKSANLCMAGGCALNIKWNSAIRSAGFVDKVYVAPFPNDSGSAIGMACIEYMKQSGKSSIDWSVYSGPEIIDNKEENSEDWKKRECSIKELAELLFRTDEPVVFLNGRAELGPRALGNRSIIASPIPAKMKDILNIIKERESYRPVSPMCLQKDVEEFFEDGIKDVYMLFDHVVKQEYLDKIPAVIHLDNSARLQSISQADNQVIYELLTEFKKISGIPILCNTSANCKGRGFFPDVKSVMEWGRANYIWCNNVLYEKTEKNEFA